MSVAFCGILLGPFALAAAQYSNFDKFLPMWITTENAKYLSGGIAKADVRGSLSLEGFVSGHLQTALEEETGNCIPAKSFALLANAALQRGSIELSNTLFGWDCTPAYYGSSLLSVQSDGRLIEAPQVASPEMLSSIDKMVKAYEQFSADHENVKTFLYLAPDSQNVAGSPAAALMSSPLTYQVIRDRFDGGGASYTWVDGEVSYSKFRENWFKTDHHWMMGGAYDAYCRVVSAMGFSGNASCEVKEVVYREPGFYGSLSRRSLNEEYVDTIQDIQMEYPDFRITIDGKEASLESLVHQEKYLKKEYDENKYANRYSEYYHGDYGLIEIVNPTPIENRSILIVGDSYTNCIERLFARDVAETYILDPRHDSHTVDDFLLEHPDVKDVVFIMRSSNFLSERTAEALG